MYHKLTVYVESRYQTNLFPSRCFSDQCHRCEHHSVNALQISFVFLPTMHNNMFFFIDARRGFNIYAILCPIDGVTCSVEQTCKNSCFYKFQKKKKNTMSCAYLYAYTEQNDVWCNMNACVIFLGC